MQRGAGAADTANRGRRQVTGRPGEIHFESAAGSEAMHCADGPGGRKRWQ